MVRERKGSSPDPQVSASTDRRVDPRLSWVVAAAALSVLAVIAASFFPDKRLWGWNHLAFLPSPFRHGAYALLVLAFVPPLARLLYRAALVASHQHAAARAPIGATITVIVALLSVGVFYKFHVATNLLGDGQLIAQSFKAAEEGHDSVIMRSAHAIVTEETIAPGTTLIYYAAVQTGEKMKKDPVVSMRVLNCILGGIFVLFVLLTARAQSLGDEPRTWLVTLALFSCSILLFFGYIENYTAPYLFASIYVVSAFAALHRRVPLWLPLIPLAMACYAHIQSILLIPSYFYLVVWMRARGRRATFMRLWLPIFSAATVVVIVSCSSVEGMKKFFVPFGFTGNTLLAPRHFADVANEIAMLMPLAPVVAVLGWLGRRMDTVREKGATKDPSTLLAHPVEWQFTATLLVSCAMYLFFFRPEIGMARDWDLFTMATVGLVPLTLLALNRYVRVSGLAASATATFAVPSLVLVAVMGTSWVALNASTDRTIDRFQRILAYDKAHAAYAWENLAILEHNRGNLQKAIDTMNIALANGNNPRHSVRLAVYLEEAGRIDDAIDVLEKVLARRPDFVKARYRLVLFLEKKNDWDKMLTVSREGMVQHPEEAFYRFLYGESLIRANRLEEGVEVFVTVRDMKLPPAARQRVDQVLAYYAAQKKR